MIKILYLKKEIDCATFASPVESLQLLNALFPPNITVLNIQNNIFYMNIKILWNFFFLFFKNYSNFDVTKKNRSFFVTLRSMCYRNYIASIIRSQKIKCLVTLSDDNCMFHWLSKICKSCKFYAIQNAVRHKVFYERERNIGKTRGTLSAYFCFSEYEKSLSKMLGYPVDNYISVGPLYTDFYQYHLKQKPKKADYFDICIASQWTRGLFISGLFPRMRKAIELTYLYLSEYCKAYPNLRIAVAARSSDGASVDEENFYRHYFSENIVFFSKKEMFSSYHAINASDLVLGFSSTLVLDAIRLGKKGVFIDFNHDDLYNYHSDFSFVVKEKNFSLFKKIIDGFLSMTKEDFQTKFCSDIAKILNQQSNAFHSISQYIQKEFS